MIGASMGAYAAIRAGLALKARVVLAYSPQVILGSIPRAAAGSPSLPWLDLLKLQLSAELEGFSPSRPRPLVTLALARPRPLTLALSPSPSRPRPCALACTCDSLQGQQLCALVYNTVRLTMGVVSHSVVHV